MDLSDQVCPLGRSVSRDTWLEERASQVFILHVPLPRTLILTAPHHPKLIKKTSLNLCLVTVISYWSEVQPVTYQPVHFREHYFTNEENESQEVN